MLGVIFKIGCHLNKDIIYIGSTLSNLDSINNFIRHEQVSEILTFFFSQYALESFYIECIKEYDIVDMSHLLAYKQLYINKYKSINIGDNINLKAVCEKKKNYYTWLIKNNKHSKLYYWSKRKVRVRKITSKQREKRKLNKSTYNKKYYRANKERIKHKKKIRQKNNKDKYKCLTCNYKTFDPKYLNQHLLGVRHIRKVLTKI